MDTTNLTDEQKALLSRILFTTQLAVTDLLPEDTGEKSDTVHIMLMAFTMIKMDVMLLLTGEDLFTKALQEVIGATSEQAP